MRKVKEGSSSLELLPLLKEAEAFHGHMGPFLVVGLRAGSIGLRELKAKRESEDLHAAVSIPYVIPYSCILDGIQFSTGCTIGNKRLSFKDSSDFAITLEDSTGRTVILTVLGRAVDELKRELASSDSPEKVGRLGHRVASMAEVELFAVETE